MKKILIVTNIVFCGLLYFQSCNNRDCTKAFYKDYSSAEWNGVIDYSTAVQMSETYAADTGKRFIWKGGVRTDSLDARSVWYDIDTLKKFLWELEYLACNSNCHDSLGVRIYFATYPDSAGMQESPMLRNLPLSYANHHTLFMVPTYWNADSSRSIDFDPSKGCRGRITNKTRFLFGEAAAASNEQNHGGLMPPPASGGTFPTN